MFSKRFVAACAALAVALTFADCSSDDTPSTPTVTAAPSRPTATATLAPEPTPTPAARPAIHIVLDTSPKPQPPEVTRVLGPKPVSAFPAWDGKSTVIYDVQTGKTLDLGPGAQPASFSPDGTKAAWAAGGDFAQGTEVFVIDLPNGQRRSLGPGRTAQFLDDSAVVVFSVGGNDRVIIDVATGARRHGGLCGPG